MGFQCPDCVGEAPQQVVRPARAQANHADYPDTIGLIAINVLAYVFEGATNFSGAVSGPLVAQGDWWRLITAGFLHVSLIHIGMNMWALWQLGRGMERSMGSVDFLICYMGALFAGSLGVVVSGTLAVGASGAIFGLFGLLAMMYSSRGISLSQSGLLGILILNLGISFFPGVSWQGHLGGFLAGLLFGAIYFVWDDQLERINPQLPRFLALAAAASFLVGGYVLSVTLY